VGNFHHFLEKGPTTSTKDVFEKILHNLSNFKKKLPYFYNRLQHATRGIKGFLKITLLNFLSGNQI